MRAPKRPTYEANSVVANVQISAQAMKYEISDLELRLSFLRNPTLATLDSVTPPIVFHYSGLKVEKLFSKLEL